MKTISGEELRKRLLSTYPKARTMNDLETENERLREALKLVSERLLVFVSAVGDIADCSADVDALAVADAALGSGVLRFQNAWGSDEENEGP